MNITLDYLDKSPETLINEEGKDVTLYNNHILVYCAFPDSFP